MKILKKIVKLIIILMFAFAVVLFFSQMWLLKTWSELTAAEVLYHILAPLNGTNPEMIKDYIIKYLVPAVLVTIIFVVVLLIIAKKKEKSRLGYVILFVFGLLLISVSLIKIEKGVGVFSYAVNYLKAKKFQGEDFIEMNYTDPKEVSITFPEKKRNLIYIFLESTEVTFADKESGGAFEQNCIPELTELARENVDFSSDSKLNGGVSLPGTDWTMGAMFGQTSGLPLQISIGANSMMNEDNFFEGVTALGDILEQEGYDQRLLLGSEAQFGGRDTYFSQHGNYELTDYNWAKAEGKIPEDYYVWWGYEDEKLFQFAREELTEMAAEDKPFNLTMLTVDTHFPDGYKCDLCEDTFGDNQYANVFACESKQTVEFVRWIQQQDFYEDTTIVICGDHPTMDPDFTDDVEKKYSRKTYTCIINGAAELQNKGTREFSTLDMFPTTLAAMGVEIEGDKLGMGVNLYSDKKTLIEEYGEQVCMDRVGLPSAFMDKLGNIKITEKDLKRIRKARMSVVTTDTPGQMAVRQKDIRSIKAASLQKAEVEIINNKTNKTDVYEMDKATDPDNPAKFSTIAYINLNEEDIKDVTVKIYFTVEGIEHYEIGTWNYDEEEKKWIIE